MASPTVENYLKALYALANEDNEINISDLSNHLNVSKPTVNSMVKTLNQQGWVQYERYKPIVLTQKGRKAAALILRKHRLTEMYLVEKMGFGWKEVHEIAEQIEHVKAPSFFDRMDRLMDFPKVDPHGSPIPDKEGNILDHDYKKEFLDSREISLKLELEIKDMEPFDSSMLISYHDHPSERMSQKVCERLLVQKL
jgi:DtxR family Mn-dependent transcriptional regulator